MDAVSCSVCGQPQEGEAGRCEACILRMAEVMRERVLASAMGRTGPKKGPPRAELGPLPGLHPIDPELERRLRVYLSEAVGGLRAASLAGFAEESQGGSAGTSAPTPRADAAELAMISRIERDEGDSRAFYRPFEALDPADKAILRAWVLPSTYNDLGPLERVALELPEVKARTGLGEGRVRALRTVIRKLGAEVVTAQAFGLLQEAGRRLDALSEQTGEAARARKKKANQARYTPRC